MERAAKLIVLLSMAIAIAIEGRMAAGGWSVVWPLTIGAFALAASLALVREDIAVGAVLFLAFTFPAAFLLTYGRFAWEYDVVWMAAALGAIFPRAARTGWAVPPRWRAVLVLWALTLAMAWPIVALREIDFDPQVLQAPFHSSSGAGGYPDAALTFILHATTTLGIGILWFDWLCTTAGAHPGRFRRVVVPSLIASWVVAVSVAAYQVFGDITFLNGGLFGYVGRASGTMYDANPFGVVAALGGPAAFAWLMGFERCRRWWVGVLVVGSSWLGLWASGSRTALIAGIIILLFLAWHIDRGDLGRLTTRKLFPIAAVGIVAVVATVSAIGSPAVGSLRRLRESLPSPSAASVSAFLGEMWNRNGYGRTATLMIAEHPLVGTGPGSFFFLVPDYSLRAGNADRLPTDNAQNWYRHQLAEFGVVGSIGWIAWVAAFGWFVLTVRPGREADRLVTGILKGSLVAIGAISLVGMPAWNPAVTLTFWTMAFWLTAVAAPASLERREWGIASAQWIGIGALLLVFLGGTAYAALGELRVANRAAQHGWHYAYGFYEPEHAADGSEFQWAGQHAVTVLPVPKPWLRLTVAVNHADVGQKPVDVKVWTDSQRVVATTLRSGDPVTEFVRLPDGASRVVLETWVSRVVRPRDFGVDDPRTLGLMVAWDFVDGPPRVAAP